MLKIDTNKVFFLKQKKGVFDVLSGSATGVVIFILVLVVGAIMLSTVKEDTDLVSVNSSAYNITTKGENMINTFSTWGKVIVIAIIAGLVFLVLGGFMGGKRRMR